MIHSMSSLPELTDEERERYAWQFDVRDFGVAGQRRLKATTVLISRIGGVGGSVALQLAAAGIGRLILAHAGDIRLNDLNRQLLMSTAAIGTPRVAAAARRLQELNPHVVVETVNANLTDDTAAEWVSRCDLVVSAAPLFTERLAMNQAAVQQRKPLVDAAMYDLEGRVMTVHPGGGPCLACLYSEPPPNWKRQFPVMSAVSSTVGSIAAMEVIKLASGIGTPLKGELLQFDLRELQFRRWPLPRRDDCPICATTPIS